MKKLFTPLQWVIAQLRKPDEWVPWVPLLGIVFYMRTKGKQELQNGEEKWINYHLKCMVLACVLLLIVWISLIIKLRILQHLLLR